MAKGSNKAKADYVSAELFESVCEFVSEGSPARKYPFHEHGKTCRTFYRWLDSQATEQQRQQYAHAMTVYRTDKMFEDILDIADGSDDARLRVDARKWMLGKMNPKRYSDKLTVAGDADNPIAVTGQLITKIEVVHVNPSLGDAS
jgi:hypothetical protein